MKRPSRCPSMSLHRGNGYHKSRCDCSSSFFLSQQQSHFLWDFLWFMTLLYDSGSPMVWGTVVQSGTKWTKSFHTWNICCQTLANRGVCPGLHPASVHFLSCISLFPGICRLQWGTRCTAHCPQHLKHHWSCESPAFDFRQFAISLTLSLMMDPSQICK